MSTEAPVERGNSRAYADKLMGLLGARDPLDVLTRTPDVVGELVRAHPRETLARRPFEGKWTPCEIVGHLCDAEWVYGYRIRLVLCEPEPTIDSMDQDLWVAGQKYNQRDPRELAAQFASLRGANLAVWRGLSAEDLARGGRHAQRGRETLGVMLRMNAGHDLSHLDQLRRYLAALG